MENTFIKTISLIAVITALMLSSCKKDNTSSPATPSPAVHSNAIDTSKHYFYFTLDTTISVIIGVEVPDMPLCTYYQNKIGGGDYYIYNPANYATGPFNQLNSPFGASDTFRINNGDILTSIAITSSKIPYNLYIDNKLIKSGRGAIKDTFR